MDATATTAEPTAIGGTWSQRWRVRPLRAWVFTFAALAAVLFLFGACLYLAFHDKETSAFYLARFLRGIAGHSGHDSWKPMLRALYEFEGNRDVPLYSRTFFDLNVKFQYPLSSLFIVEAAQRLIEGNWRAIYAALNWVSWFVVWGIGIVCWRLFLASGGAGGAAADRRDSLLLLGAGLALTLLFYPLTISFDLGQIQTTMTLLLALALLWWPHGRRGPGFLIGLCCALKPQWAVLLVWGALRREWSFVWVGTLTFAVLLLASGAVYGFGNHLNYLKVLSFLSQHGESHHLNQSVNGLMNRLLFTDNNLEYNEIGKRFQDFHPAVYAATLGSSALILLAALAFRWRERPGRLDLALIMLSATIASPVAWVHHYAILLPIFALLAPLSQSMKPFGRWSGAYLLIAFVLASQRISLVDQWAYTRWNLVQTYLLFAGFMVLGLLYWAAAKKPARASP